MKTIEEWLELGLFDSLQPEDYEMVCYMYNTAFSLFLKPEFGKLTNVEIRSLPLMRRIYVGLKSECEDLNQLKILVNTLDIPKIIKKLNLIDSVFKSVEMVFLEIDTEADLLAMFAKDIIKQHLKSFNKFNRQVEVITTPSFMEWYKINKNK